MPKKPKQNKRIKNGVRPSQINPTKNITTAMGYSGPLNYLGLPLTGRNRED